MSVLPIVQWPDARLTEICAPVDAPDALGSLIDDMFETMYAAPGRGLAAPQVGVLQRFFVMDTTWKDGDQTPYVCINPEIVAASDEMTTGSEACLSIPSISAEVTRPSQITLAYTDRTGERREEVLTGAAAICAQHELDHLNGVVIFDRVDPDTRAKLVQAYEANT